MPTYNLVIQPLVSITSPTLILSRAPFDPRHLPALVSCHCTALVCDSYRWLRLPALARQSKFYFKTSHSFLLLTSITKLRTHAAVGWDSFVGAPLSETIIIIDDVGLAAVTSV